MSEQNEKTSLAQNVISFTVSYRSTIYPLSFPKDSTIGDLRIELAKFTSIEPHLQKLITKGHILTDNAAPIPLSLNSAKILLLGSSEKAVKEIQEAKPPLSRSASPYSIRPSKNSSRSIHTSATPDLKYTFHRLMTLPGFRDEDKALQLLNRLKHDRGVIAVMKKHKFAVGTLMEMDPATNTSHSGKTLGLNRNSGEAIELRLRTDSYDGFRDFRGIRAVLCHELSHNIWGEHDHNFWALTKQLEREVVTLDPFSAASGHRLGSEEFYHPDAEFEEDEGSKREWEGGSHVLGGEGSNGVVKRIDLAQAAEKRFKEEQERKRTSASQEGRMQSH